MHAALSKQTEQCINQITLIWQLIYLLFMLSLHYFGFMFSSIRLSMQEKIQG